MVRTIRTFDEYIEHLKKTDQFELTRKENPRWKGWKEPNLAKFDVLIINYHYVNYLKIIDSL